MKRFAAALLALALLLTTAALAFDGVDYPPWDGAAVPSAGFNGNFGGERISLSLDASPEFSNVESGAVETCFYAYDASGEHYLELYLVLPQSAASGDVLRSDEDGRCSISLYEVALGGETLYYAGDRDGSNASYEIALEAVESTAASIRMQGSLTARLCRYDGDRPSPVTLDVSEARFGFTLPLSASEPLPSAAPEQDPGLPGETFPALPDETFPALPDETFPALPDETFPALPDFSSPTFPALPDAPRSGAGPYFTLPPDYVTL